MISWWILSLLLYFMIKDYFKTYEESGQVNWILEKYWERVEGVCWKRVERFMATFHTTFFLKFYISKW